MNKLNSVMKQSKKQMTYDKHFSTTELCQLLGVSRQYIAKLVREGKIAVEQQDKGYRYKFRKQYIEKHFNKIAKKYNATSVEDAYLSLAYCSMCYVKFEYNRRHSADGFIYYGQNTRGDRFCNDCTKELPKAKEKTL